MEIKTTKQIQRKHPCDDTKWVTVDDFDLLKTKYKEGIEIQEKERKDWGKKYYKLNRECNRLKRLLKKD